MTPKPEINLGELELKRGDFDFSWRTSETTYEQIMEGFIREANALLKSRLTKAQRVYCRLDDGKWACDEHPGFARADHIGILICVERVKEGEK